MSVEVNETNINSIKKEIKTNKINKNEIEKDTNKNEIEKEKNEREKEINEFLNKFFLDYHPRRPLLLENIKEIYTLISYLNDNMKPLELEDIDFRETKEATLEEKIHLIEDFYQSIGVTFNFNKTIQDGTFEIIRTNPLDDILNYELIRGRNNYIGEHKSIEVYNNGLLTDSIIWVHEISHYRNQTDDGRGQVNSLLTELLAFTESFIYLDYLEKQGYKKETIAFKISEYKNLYNVIKIAYLSVRIYLLYFLLGEISKENYKYLYKEDESYDNALNVFENLKEQDQSQIFTIIWYSIGAISLYNYERYKEDNNHVEKLKELNEKIESTTLEEALKTMDIKLDGKSLTKILEGINKFKNRLVEEQSNYIKK